MTDKTYGNIILREEKNSVILISPETRIIMPRETWRAILADNIKKVMKGNSHPDNVTITQDNITEEV